MAEISRVLVANRGEIALRIIRACHEERLEAVAVYSQADRLSPHVRAAELAVPIGPAPAVDSYLNMGRLIEAARSTGCQAIHPGYGFLSERAPFADAVARAGLVFIGPPAAAIVAMGDKTEARRRMQAAGVPIVPGTTQAVSDAKRARYEATRLGFPVLLKAVAGGGGKGMRLVHEPGELEAAFQAAQGEALRAFGAGDVYVEKYLQRPRHVRVLHGHGRREALAELVGPHRVEHLRLGQVAEQSLAVAARVEDAVDRLARRRPQPVDDAHRPQHQAVEVAGLD